jgi:hypothetical protein
LGGFRVTSELFTTLVIIGGVGFVLWFVWFGMPWLLRDDEDERVPFREVAERIERENER